MAVKIKDKAKVNEGHVSRFNYTRKDSVGTIEELIEELNIECPKINGERIQMESLAGAISFIERTTGHRIGDQYEKLPIATIKLIKLLYVENERSGMHLFRLLSSPGELSKPTMEFSTGTTISRDISTANLVDSIASTLSLEIAEDKLELFRRLIGDDAHMSSSEKLLRHIERANDVIWRVFTDRIVDDDLGMADAYRALSRYMDSHHVRGVPGAVTPLNEAVFVHIETLALQHFILHHKEHLERIRIEGKIGSITSDLFRFCETLAVESGVPEVDPFDGIYSVKNFHHVVLAYPSEFTSLVKAATGLDTRKRRLFENTVRARAILVSHAYRSFDEADPEAPVISLIDIVAALCSFRVQQEIKTQYSPYWHGQKSQGADPQRLFDKGLRVRDPHQHQGVFQIYYYRFLEYREEFSGTSSSHNAWMAFQLSRLDAYLRIVRLNGIIRIFAASSAFDYLCMEKAMEIAMNYPGNHQ
ncbi:MAG: hypothetical protein FH747_07640 [Stenotrophomonas sp.]|uniref:hypothetical protein n=1 Tax=Stenotrophomonas sp. TaxID=69392 RepID=UPI0013558676|nr:hypothetical protein [Stenotrophomonas sp.]MTI73511.1 hypothetical protein [Stenotrophomonas sp.]